MIFGIPIGDFLTKIVAPALTILYIVLDRWKKISDARRAEETVRRNLAIQNQKLIDDLHATYQGQIEYLKETLDDCLDSSRPHRPDAKGG